MTSPWGRRIELVPSCHRYLRASPHGVACADFPVGEPALRLADVSGVPGAAQRRKIDVAFGGERLGLMEGGHVGEKDRMDLRVDRAVAATEDVRQLVLQPGAGQRERAASQERAVLRD